jgi:23S rRNA pseudouridine1911/1915/1917 synthase
MKSAATGNKFFHPGWPVFYEDNHLLVVYKPAMLPVQQGMQAGVSMLDLAKKWVAARYRKPGRVYLGLVHRLDFPVAGVMVFARTSKAAGRLSAQFREGSVGKRYLAVVDGVPSARTGTLSQHIVRGEKRCRIAGNRDKNARDAILDYRVVDTFKKRALLEVELRTGRKHQIRLQLSHFGHPVVGDTRYGSFSPAPYGCIALMSRVLVFHHPTKTDTLSFQCPVPEGWPWPKALDAEGEVSPPWTWHKIQETLANIFPLTTEFERL